MYLECLLHLEPDQLRWYMINMKSLMAEWLEQASQ